MDEYKRKITARELGVKTEQKVLKYIFPQCSAKPFGIKTYNGLIQFIDDIHFAVEKELCRETAMDAWAVLEADVKVNVICRLNKIKEMFPTLKDDLRELREFTAGFCFDDDDEEDILSALQTCQTILNVDL